MKKSIIFLFFLVIGIYFVNAQDIITMRDGRTIEARVMEIHPSEIRYKRFDHLDGPMIVVPISNIAQIRYSNGRVETFSGATYIPPASASSSAGQTNQNQSIGQEILQTDLVQGYASQLGVPTSLLQALNMLPAIPIAGRNLKFAFATETWSAQVNGKNYASGSVTTSNTGDGFILALKQTHIYVRNRQVKSPELTMYLEFKPGPPVSFRVISSKEMEQEAQGEYLASLDEDSDSSSKKSKREKEEKEIDDTWRKKWLYLGGAIGTGFVNEYNFGFRSYYYQPFAFYSGALLAEVSLLPFLSFESGFILTRFNRGHIGISDYRYSDYYQYLYPRWIPVIPLLFKMGYRFWKMEIFADTGWIYPVGFSFGGTLGFNLGPGVLTGRYLFSTPDFDKFNAHNIFIGYKVGIIDKKKKVKNMTEDEPIIEEEIYEE